MRSNNIISTEQRKNVAEARLLNEKNINQQRLLQKNNAGNGWFDTMQKAAEKGCIPDHTCSFEHGWTPKNNVLDNNTTMSTSLGNDENAIIIITGENNDANNTELNNVPTT